MHTFLAYLAAFAAVGFMWGFAGGLCSIPMALMVKEPYERYKTMVDRTTDKQLWAMTGTTAYLAWYVFVYLA
jgi:hypothetical protein